MRSGQHAQRIGEALADERPSERDHRLLHRRQLARLRGLGVRMATLNPKLAQRRFLQLLETFVVGELRAA